MQKLQRYFNIKPPYQRSTCRLEKVFKAASRVKSLKPHCVSLIPLTQKNHTRKWNPYIRNVRNRDRCHQKKQKNANAIFSRMNINGHAPVFCETVLPEPLNLLQGELWIRRRSPCYPSRTHEKIFSEIFWQRTVCW